jgi:hypothetical protein
MLTKFFPFLDPAMIEPDLPAKLRKLANDLEAIRHFPPSTAALHDAPSIDQWLAMLTPTGVCLIGDVSGHPQLGDRPATTSPLWAADPDGKWVRTTSRFYRLGEPAGPEIRQVLQSVFDAYRGERDDDETRTGGRS